MVDNRGLIKRMPVGPGSIIAKLFNDEFNIDRFDTVLNEMWGMYDNLWKNTGLVGGSFAELQSPLVKFPKVNVKQFEDHYEVNIAVAGFDKKDISLELKDNCLLIKAEKSIDETKEEGGEYLVREIASRSFRRCIEFPEKIDTSAITDNCIEYTDGIVKIDLKKLEAKKEEDTIKLTIK